MNVCLVSREYPPFFGGGIGTYNVQWARTLSRAGHRVVVVTVSDDGVQRREQADGLAVVRLPFLKGSDWSGPHPAIQSPRIAAAFRSLHPVSAFALQVEQVMPALVREFSLDIIEVPDTGAVAWFGLNNRRLGGSWTALPPVVTTIHSPTAWIAHYNRQPLALRHDHELVAMEHEAALWSDALISPSSALAEWTTRQWGLSEGAVEVIPYPLGDLQDVAAAGQAPGRRDSFKLLFIGRLEPRKGIDTLLMAMAELNDRRIELDAAGEDTLDPARPGKFGANSLESCRARIPAGSVRLLGRRPPEELSGLRAGADAVVIPSPMDNFPYVCVEAMAEGRLVIASSAGGTGEMIRHGVDGFLFEPGNAAALAGAIRSAMALGDEDRRRMMASAADRIRDFCGNDQIVSRRLAQYERTIRRAVRTTVRTDSEPVVCINRGRAEPAAVAQLTHAVRATGEDFAHGWVETEAGVQAFSTPRLRTLSLSARILGPLVVRESALERAGVRELLRPGPDGGLHTQSPWALAMELCAAGCTGACVPDVVTPVTTEELHPVERALIEELKMIHGSRGWRLLNKVYDVLHVVRGRGLRRPYHSGARG